MKKAPIKTLLGGALGALSGAGLAEAFGNLAVLARGGWEPGMASAPGWIAALSAAAGWAAWYALARATGRAGDRGLSSLTAGFALAPGLLGWLSSAAYSRLLAPPFSNLDFSRLGALRWGTRWVETAPGGYLCVGFAGLVLMGVVIGAASAWWRSGRTPWVALAVALAVAGGWRTFVFPPTGDEPYILMSTSSLLNDGNLDLADDLARGDDRNIHPLPFRGDLTKHHRVPGRHGEVYTYHGLLLPYLYLPGYALAGRVGLSILLAALCAVLLAGLAGTLGATGFHARSARTTAALLAIASPLPVFTIFLSPDLPTAGLVALGFAGLLTGRPGLVLSAVAVLPWVHHKAVLPALGLVLGTAMAFGWRRALGVLAVLGISGLGLMLAAHRATLMPVWPPADFFAYYSSQYQGGFDPRNIPAAAFGTLFDRHQGAAFFPALLLSLAGFLLLPGKTARLAGAVAAPYVLALLMFSQWSGGSGAPGRMLVVVLPLLAFPLAAVVERLSARGWGKWILRAVFALGALLLWALSAMPALSFTSARGRAETMLAGKLGHNPLGFLPDLAVKATGAGLVHGAILTIILAGIIMVLVAKLRKKR